MSDDIRIPADDQQSIDAFVAAFRSRVENLYRMAYLQGAIDEAKSERDKMIARDAVKPRVLLRIPVSQPTEAETKLQRAARIYGRPFGTNGKTTKGISFWTAERIAELAQANQAHRAARK